MTAKIIRLLILPRKHITWRHLLYIDMQKRKGNIETGKE